MLKLLFTYAKEHMVFDFLAFNYLAQYNFYSPIRFPANFIIPNFL